VFATDLQAHRLVSATEHGATALPYAELGPAVLAATEGRGADAVLEVVGHESALKQAIALVRPYGAVSVVGVHAVDVKLSGDMLYNKKCVILVSGW
jgi:threonine dehydrogenase-like Zn-dependent dehydrogenase